MTAGDLDPTFGNSGKVEFSAYSGQDTDAQAVAIDGAGRIVLAGRAVTPSGPAISVSRLNPDGSLDSTFGSGGTRSIILPGTESSYASAVAIDAAGRIVVAGQYTLTDASRTGIAMARLSSDGILDTSFNGTGMKKILLGADNAYATDVAIGPLGRIIVVSPARNASGNLDFGVIRLDDDGSPDTSFNSTGFRLVDFYGENDVPNAVLVNPSGQLIVAGSATASGDHKFAVVGLNASGSINPSYYYATITDDLYPEDGYREFTDAAFDSSGRVVLSGAYYGTDGVNRMSVFRLATDGTLDTSFNSTGYKDIPFDFGRTKGAMGNAIAVDGVGRIVVAGSATAVRSGSFMAVSRLDDDGSFDLSFDTDGRVIVSIGDDNLSGARGLAIGPDNDVIVAGSSLNDGLHSAAVSRLLGVAITPPPVITPPVVTPPVITPPVITPPVITPPVVTPPVIITPPPDTIQPSVVSVIPLRVGRKLKGIRISFSESLLEFTATAPGNYQLAMKVGRRFKRIRVGMATYDATTQTITLGRLGAVTKGKQVQLTVHDGVVDLAGNGLMGGNYVKLLKV